MSVASPLIALAVTVVIGVILFSALGKDPLRGLQMFFVEPVKNAYAWSEIAIKATPLQVDGVLYFTIPDHAYAVAGDFAGQCHVARGFCRHHA